MIIASEKGFAEIVVHLLSQPNIDINYKDILIQNYPWYLNPIFFFIIFQFRIIFGIELNHFNHTALIYAAFNGYTNIVDHLSAQPNIDINCKDILISKLFIIL